MINFFYSALHREIEAIESLKIPHVLDEQKKQIIDDITKDLDLATNDDLSDIDTYNAWERARIKAAQLVADARTIEEVASGAWEAKAVRYASLASRIITCVSSSDPVSTSMYEGHVWLRTNSANDAKASVCSVSTDIQEFSLIDMHTYVTLIRNRILAGDPQGRCFCGHIAQWLCGATYELAPVMQWDGVLSTKRPTQSNGAIIGDAWKATIGEVS